MVDHEAFLRAIEQNRDDPLPRLIYADWLEEQGDIRAEYLRLDVELSEARKQNQPLNAQLVARHLDLEDEFAWTGWPWGVRRFHHHHWKETFIYPSFWRLLESAGKNLIKLSRQLETFPDKRLKWYCQQYEEAKDCVNPSCWQACYPFKSAELPYTSDGGEDFAEWVVAAGRAFYEQVRATPERIDEYYLLSDRPPNPWDIRVDREEYRGRQSPKGIAYAIYRARHGRNLDPWS